MSNLGTAKQHREERANVHDQMRAMVATAKEEGRELSAEEVEQFDRMEAEDKSLLSKIETLERFERVDDLRSQVQQEQTKNVEPKYSRITAHDKDQALRGWLLGNTHHMTAEHRDAMHKVGLANTGQLVCNFHDKQHRAIDDIREYRGTSNTPQSLTAAHGGNTVADELMREVEVALLAHGGVRNVANVIRTNTGADLPIPTSNDTNEKGKRLGENTEDKVESVAFGQTVMKSFKYTSKLIKASVEILQDNGISLPEFLGEALGTRIARITNDEFTISASTNTSVNPEGIVSFSVASSTGEGTASNASVTFVELVNFLHSVDPAYRTDPSFGFMFNDQTLRQLKTMVDGYGRPLWLPGLAVREPDTILGYRYTINQSMGSQTASGDKFMLAGAMNKYLVRDVKDFSLIRMDERYAEFGQVAFVAMTRHDGRGINAGTNPIKHLASGSST